MKRSHVVDAWNIHCDFDGTISRVDVIDALLERYGKPGWNELENAWRTGKIGSRECMSGQVALLDLDRAELDDYLADASIDPGFPTFAAEARRLGMPLQIVSDGLDLAIHVILARHGLALPVAANQLTAVSTRRWTLASPFQSSYCASGTCKCACIDRGRNQATKSLLIGDGASDFCAASHADLVFAKSRLIDHCIDHDIAHVAISGFDEATALLPMLRAGALTPSTRPVRASA
ncbi:MAG: MtnX-like HAD-IB family phosphatase [Dokdonella sp.]